MPADGKIGSVPLDVEFLKIRAGLLDIASALDRVGPVDDARLAKIREAVTVLGEKEDERASRVQMLFSLPFDKGWRSASAQA